MLRAAVLLALTAGGMAWAQPANSDAPQPAASSESSDDAAVVHGPQWLRKATGADVGLVYPREAARQNRAGRARIGCSVVATGHLKECTILSEDPEGAGFGAAALKLAPKFQMTPILKDGRSTEGGVVIIPLNFIPGALPPLVTLQEIRRSDPGAPTGRASVRCRVSYTSAKPIFEGCVALQARPKELGPYAVEAAAKIALPPGTPGGLVVGIPFVFEANDQRAPAEPTR